MKRNYCIMFLQSMQLYILKPELHVYNPMAVLFCFQLLYHMKQHREDYIFHSPVPGQLGLHSGGNLGAHPGVTHQVKENLS